MRPKLFTLAAGASAVLCIAVVAAWVRSHSKPETVWRLSRSKGDFGYSAIQIYVAAGELRAERITGEAYRLYEPPGFGHRPEPLFVLNSPPKTVAGFAHWDSWRSVPFYSEQRSSWIVPIWSLAALLGVMPLIWLVRRLAGRRRGETARCPACGYDLRATPGRCPECGAAHTAKGEQR